MNDDDAESRVLDVAARLFYEQGIQAVGMDRIRDASGVSLKRLYRLFPAKEQLVEATLRHRERQALDALERTTRGDATPEAKILAIFDLLGDWFSAPDYRGCDFINAFGELGAQSERVAHTARDHKQRWRDLLADLVAQAGRPPQLADQLALLVNGAMVTAGMRGSPAPARDARAAAESLLRRSG